MRVLIINEVCGYTSTGSICADLAEYFSSKGHLVRVLYGRMAAPDRCKNYSIRIAGRIDVGINALSARLFDNCGNGNIRSTKVALDYIKKFAPDIVHLHNLHGYYINYKLLFDGLKLLDIPVIYTLHDCWSFTGHCAYFDSIGCEKWMHGCEKCPQKRQYPMSWFVDRSKDNYNIKKTTYLACEKLKVVVPSVWLKKKVDRSIINHEAVVIPNGIDTGIFSPSDDTKVIILSIFVLSNNITEKKVILGVASLWEPRKGISFFNELSKIISDEFQIVLVGSIGRRYDIPNNIITIKKVTDKKELSMIYSSAYVYLNPTLEDNYPTTNLEAICCGTPVLTFNTGGSPESAIYYGEICEKNTDSVLKAINNIDSLSGEGLNEARELFDVKHMMKQYEHLYEKMIKKYED